jgi:hypothetical protein
MEPNRIFILRDFSKNILTKIIDNRIVLIKRYKNNNLGPSVLRTLGLLLWEKLI